MAIIRNLVVKIGADISGLSRGLKQAQSNLLGLSKGLTSIGSSLTAKVTMPLVLLAGTAMATSAKFEQSMANAASVSGATGAELEKMTAVAREMGRTTVYSASQAADAMYFMASAGYKAEQMAVAIQPILNLAAATQSDLAFATDTVIATLNQFQLEASEAERVSNVFASAIGNSQATIDKLGTSMGYVGPVANSLGWSLEETTGALSVLYNAGYDGSMAGTSLRQSLVALMNPTAKAKKVFEELGINLQDLDPTTNKFSDIVNILKESGLSTAQAMEVFGARAGPGMMALLAQGGDAIADMTDKITGTNAAYDMAERQINTMQGSAKIMKSMMEDIAITIGDVLVPMIRELMEKYLMPLMEKFQGLSNVSKEFVIKIGMVAASIGPLFLVLGKVVKIVATAVKVLGMIATPVGLIIVAILAVVAVLVYLFKTNEGFRKKILGIWTKIQEGIKTALGGIKKWWEENGERVINAIGRVFTTLVSIIMFCVGVVVTLVQKLWNTFKTLWNNNSEFGQAIKNIWQMIVTEVNGAITKIVEWWRENGQQILTNIIMVFNAIWDVVVAVLDQIIKSVTVFLGYLEPIWSQVKQVFMSLWELICQLWELLEPLFVVIGAVLATVLAAALGVINGIIQALGPFIQAVLNVLQIVIDVVNAIVALLRGDLDGAWEYIKSAGANVGEFFKNLWQAILNFGKGFVDAFLGFFSSFGVDFVAVVKDVCKKVGDWFVSLWEGIVNGAKNIWNAITGVFRDIGNFFGNLFKDAFNWGKNLIKCIVDGIYAAIEWVGDAIKSVGQKIKNFLGFSSPTKEGPGSTADEWMPNMMDMFVSGINKGLPDIEGAVNLTATELGGVSGASMQPLDSSNQINGLLSAMSIMQSNNKSSNEPIELSIDGQVFARLILPSLSKEFRRNGIKLEGAKEWYYSK